MPKLLQIGIEVNRNSTGRIAEQIGDVALSCGWESYIAYARGFNPSSSKVIKIGNNLDIIFHVLQTRLFDNHGFASILATKKLINHIKKIEPDIIHLHQIHGYYLNIELLFNYFSSISTPIIWSLHDCWAMTGHCAHFVLINCNKWKTQCFKCPQKYAYPKSIFLDRSKYNYEKKKKLFTSLPSLTLVPTSLWVENLARESYLSNISMHTITNGIDTNTFKPYFNRIEILNKYKITGEFVIIGVGTEWNENKGLYDYFKLRKKLTKEFTIVLVGVSKKLLSKLPSGIIGIARTENVTELASLYSAADVVTSLSYIETFGLTPVEGFSCGTPAIVYNCTALPELITPEVGYIVQPGNIVEIIQCLNDIKLKGKKYFSENCRKHAEKMYNKNNKYREYIDLYNSIK